MARGKKGGPSRLDLRRQADAAEAREGDEVEDDVEDDEADDEDSGDEDEDGKPKKKKAKPKAKAEKKPAAPKKPAAKRTRTPKEVRMKAVWVVFDNSSKRVDTFPFSQKPAAEELLARKQEEKKGSFYLQLVKEQMD